MVGALILKLVRAILALLLAIQPEFTVYEDGSGALQDGSVFCIENSFCAEQPGYVQSAKFFGEAP